METGGSVISLILIVSIEKGLRMRAGLLCCLISILVGLGQCALGDDWPQFRGPAGLGLSAEKQLPAEWGKDKDGKDKNIIWKVKIPGVAWSSPIVWGDRVFITTAMTDKQAVPKAGGGGFGDFGFGGFGGGPPDGGGRKEAAKDAKKDSGKKDSGKTEATKDGEPKRDGEPKTPPKKKERPKGSGGGGFGGFGGFGERKPPDAMYRWEVYCLDRADGKVLWKQLAIERKPTIPIHSTNTYASETPVTDGERLYAYFGMTGLFCYDLAGKLVWSKDLGTYPMMFGFGAGSSPALDGDRLFVQCDNEKQPFLIAFDKKTGSELWRMDRPGERSSWGTPFVWKNKARTEIVCVGQRVRSYDPATGKLLWELGGNGGQCAATPVADAETIYFGAGGLFGSSPLFAVKAGAAGDISLKSGETSNASVAWHRTRSGPSIASPLLYDGYLYILEQRGGILACYDAKTGKPAYDKVRISGAKGFSSSPWAYDGKIFCLDEDGQTFVLAAGPKYKLLGKNALGEMFWSSPAIAGGSLLLRGVENLYCVRAAGP